MKSFLVKIFVLFFVIAALYAGYFSYRSLEKERIGIVEDVRNNRIIRIFYNEKNFVWQGAFPWWFSIYEIPSKKSMDIDVEAAVPPLEVLNSPLYSLKITFNIKYSIDPEKFNDFSIINRDLKDIDKSLRDYLSKLIVKEIYQYFIPDYKAEQINSNKEEILNSIRDSLKERFQNNGFEIISVKAAGSIIYPDREIYNEGLTHLTEMRKIDKDNEKKLKLLQNRLKLEKVKNEYKYNKYKEMSKIIKENPDILKYIYIDKMADNVKVIIPSDKSGFPLDLNKKENGSGQVGSSEEGGEINNLR